MNADDLEHRLTVAVNAMRLQTEFAAELQRQVDAFFARHPEIERTKGAEQIATVIVFERLSHADGQSAQQPSKQVA